MSKHVVRRWEPQDGAAAVEFAIIVPLFFMLVMGMITGGIAFNRKLSLAHASRESVRVAATLPTGVGAVPDSWFEEVGARAAETSAGELEATAPGQTICVAYIGFGSPDQSGEDQTAKRIMTAGTWGTTQKAGDPTNPSTWCYDDGLPYNGEKRRVQVVVSRTTEFNAVLFATTLTITSEAVARFEAVTPA